jgi:hypothetical protein
VLRIAPSKRSAGRGPFEMYVAVSERARALAEEPTQSCQGILAPTLLSASDPRAEMITLEQRSR